MTVSTAHNRTESLGTCSRFIFPYTFRILDQAHLEVYVDCALQTLGTHYSVTGVGNEGGGNIELVSAPNLGELVLAIRVVPLTQLTNYVEGSRFPASSHEKALDKLAMADQQLEEELDRAIKLPVNSRQEDIAFPVPGASQFIRWNAAGTALEAATITATGVATATLTGYATASVPSGLEAGTLFRLTDGLHDVRMAVAGGHHTVSGDVAHVRAFAPNAGDGSTECSAGFRAAHDALPTTRGGTILVGPGIHMVNPVWDSGAAANCTIMCPITTKNVKVIGMGRDVTVIKVISNADNYAGLFCAPNVASGEETDISGFELRNLTVDLNYAGNTLASKAPLSVSVGGGHATRRAVVHGRRGQYVTVDNCRFLDVPRQSILFRQNTGAAYVGCTQHIRVTHNIFETTITDSGFDDTDTEEIEDPDFDVTAVLVGGRHLDVSYNFFLGRPTTYFLSRTGLAATGSHVTVHGNTFDKIYRAIQVGATGMSEVAENITVTDNTVHNANGGIELFAKSRARTNDFFQVSPGARNITVRGNTIHADKHSFARNASDGGTPFGIKGIDSNDLGFENVVIEGNAIHFVEWAQDGGFGIDFQTCAGAFGCMRGIVIANNIVKNAPRSGINIAVEGSQCVRGVTIRGNLIENPGTRQLSASKQGIRVTSCVHDLVIEGNTVRDTRTVVAGTTCTIDEAIRLTFAGPGCSVYIRGNVIDVPSCATTVPLVNITNNRVVPFYQETYICGRHVVPSHAARFGSSFLETETGTLFQQVLFPSGDLWSCTRTFVREGTLTTTDATAATVFSHPLDNCTTYHARLVVSGVIGYGQAGRASYVREGTFHRTGGGNAAGVVTNIHAHESENSWDATMDASSTNIRVRVTGCATETVKWRARLELTPVKED